MVIDGKHNHRQGACATPGEENLSVSVASVRGNREVGNPESTANTEQEERPIWGRSRRANR